MAHAEKYLVIVILCLDCLKMDYEMFLFIACLVFSKKSILTNIIFFGYM